MDQFHELVVISGILQIIQYTLLQPFLQTNQSLQPLQFTNESRFSRKFGLGDIILLLEVDNDEIEHVGDLALEEFLVGEGGEGHLLYGFEAECVLILADIL